MTDDNSLSREDNEFAERIGERLRASTDELDAATLSRLNRARQRALQELPGHRPPGIARWLIPVAAVAGTALIAVLVLQRPSPVVEEIPIARNTGAGELIEIDLLLGEDELEMIEELEFYVWLAEQELERAG